MNENNSEKIKGIINRAAQLKFPNLLPLMNQEYRKSAINTLKNWFVDSLLECIKEEREYCRLHKLEPNMNQDNVDHIQGILDKCKDVYEIQALANYVFLENEIPKDYQTVKSRGFKLRLMYPSLEK